MEKSQVLQSRFERGKLDSSGSDALLRSSLFLTHGPVCGKLVPYGLFSLAQEADSSLASRARLSWLVNLLVHFLTRIDPSTNLAEVRCNVAPIRVARRCT